MSYVESCSHSSPRWESDNDNLSVSFFSDQFSSQKNSLVLEVAKDRWNAPLTPRSHELCRRISWIGKTERDQQSLKLQAQIACQILLNLEPMEGPAPYQVIEKSTQAIFNIVSSVDGPLVVLNTPIDEGSQKIVYIGIIRRGASAVLRKKNQRRCLPSSDENFNVKRGLELIQGPIPYVVVPEQLGDDCIYRSTLFERRGWDSYFANMTLSERQEQLKTFIPQIARGIWELHQRQLVHGDVKPDNLLVSSLFMPEREDSLDQSCLEHQASKNILYTRLSDLDSVFAVQQGKCPPTKLRTYIFLPPQYNTQKISDWMKIEPEYDPRSDDVWALGVTVFYTLAGQLPPILRQVRSSLEAFTVIDLVWENSSEFEMKVREELCTLLTDLQLIEDVCAMLKTQARCRPPISVFLRSEAP